MGFIRKRRGVPDAGDESRTVPAPSKTLGHSGAITFTQAVIDERWDDAQSIFAAGSLTDQAHSVSVASDIVAPPSFFDDFVDAQSGTGLAELLRGAIAVVNAWDARAEASDAKAIDQFHLDLAAAEQDLHAAAELMPESSIPWQHLLTSGRGLHTGRAEMDDRYVQHISRGGLLSGHMAFQQLISDKWAGSHEEMWEHAEWMTRTAQPGSPNPALAAVALIEHHIAGNARRHTIHELPAMLGKEWLIGEAMSRSYQDPAFDSSTPQGAAVLSIWFTLHYLMGNWGQAAELIPMIGERFARFPMAYFQDAPWLEIQNFVNARQVQAA